jgi:hypothetical protein
MRESVATLKRLAVAARQRLLLASRARRAAILHHPESMLRHQLARTVAVAAQAPPELIARICEAFIAAGGGEGNAGQSMWSSFARRNTQLIGALQGRDHARVAGILGNPAGHEQLYGIDTMARSLVSGVERLDAGWLALWACDALLRLAEATGAVRGENPETYLYGAPRPIDTEGILTALDAALGLRVEFPNPYAGEIGIATSRGVASYRPLAALYQAWAVRRLVGPGARVLEIGAGLGRGAFYANRLGVASYTIVDLPLTAACQAHFLGCVLGAGAVSLHGETPRAIHIAAPEAFLDGSLGRFDLVINVDSMTEMDPRFARQYWDAIKRDAGLFLSINHEINAFKVRDFIAGDPDVREASRAPAWMRRGYVEELVRFG